MTLRNYSEASVEDQVWLSVLGALDLTPAERRVLVLARHTGSVSRRVVNDAHVGAPPSGLLAGLVTKGLLVRRGQRGGSHYTLSDEVRARAGPRGWRLSTQAASAPSGDARAREHQRPGRERPPRRNQGNGSCTPQGSAAERGR